MLKNRRVVFPKDVMRNTPYGGRDKNAPKWPIKPSESFKREEVAPIFFKPNTDIYQQKVYSHKKTGRRFDLAQIMFRKNISINYSRHDKPQGNRQKEDPMSVHNSSPSEHTLSDSGACVDFYNKSLTYHDLRDMLDLIMPEKYDWILGFRATLEGYGDIHFGEYDTGDGVILSPMLNFLQAQVVIEMVIPYTVQQLKGDLRNLYCVGSNDNNN